MCVCVSPTHARIHKPHIPCSPSRHSVVLVFFLSSSHECGAEILCSFFFLLHFFSPLISPRFHSFSFRAAGSCSNSDATSLANMYNTETNGIPLSKEEGVKVGTNPVPHESLTPSTLHVYFYPPHPHTSVHSLRGEGEEGSALGRSRAVRNYDALVVAAPSFESHCKSSVFMVLEVKIIIE